MFHKSWHCWFCITTYCIGKKDEWHNVEKKRRKTKLRKDKTSENEKRVFLKRIKNLLRLLVFDVLVPFDVLAFDPLRSTIWHSTLCLLTFCPLVNGWQDVECQNVQRIKQLNFMTESLPSERLKNKVTSIRLKLRPAIIVN